MSNETQTIDKKKSTITRSEVVKRIPHFCNPEKVDGKSIYHIQAIYGDGELKTLLATRAVWEKVRGERSGADLQVADLGIRNLASCQFLLHFNEKTVCGIDIIPARYYTRGAAPVTSRNSIRKGFLLNWDADLNGFELTNENLSEKDFESNSSFRVGYTGLTEKTMINLLQAIRAAGVVGSRKKAHVVENHKVNLVEEGVYRVIPQASALPKSNRLSS